jgi:hypothetical protein
LVSVDHFRYELITQLRSAAVQGATTIVVNSTELCRSLRNANHSTHACCEAMQAEIKPVFAAALFGGATGTARGVPEPALLRIAALALMLNVLG